MHEQGGIATDLESLVPSHARQNWQQLGTHLRLGHYVQNLQTQVHAFTVLTAHGSQSRMVRADRKCHHHYFAGGDAHHQCHHHHLAPGDGLYVRIPDLQHAFMAVMLISPLQGRGDGTTGSTEEVYSSGDMEDA